MRVLLVDRSERGGIAVYSDQLRDALRDAGHQVWLCAPPDRGADPPPLARHLWGYEAEGLSRRELRVRRLREVPVSTLALGRAIRRHQPDVVHAQTEILPRLDPVLWGIVRHRVPVVVTAHDPTPLEGGDDALQRQAKVWRSADAVIVHDDLGRDVVHECAPHTLVRVVPFDLARIPPTPDRETARELLGLAPGPIALALGLLRDYKGFDLLADAWPTVVAARSDASLYVVGDAAELPIGLDRLVKEPGVQLRKGFVPAEQFGLWAAAADVILTPYHHGSHSGILNQALVSRTPMLSSPALAQEVLRTGAGRVVEHNSAAWSEAMIDALWRDPLPVPPVPTSKITVQETTALYQALVTSRPYRRSSHAAREH